MDSLVNHNFTISLSRSSERPKCSCSVRRAGLWTEARLEAYNYKQYAESGKNADTSLRSAAGLPLLRLSNVT